MNDCRTILTFLGLATCILAGCGSGEPSRENLSGKVTFAGQPVVFGVIDFVPDSEAGHQGPAGSAQIINGEYDTAKSGSGIYGGAHLIRITAYEEPPPPASEDETKPTESKPPIFSGYTIQASIGEGTRDFDVPADAKGFDLMKQNVQRARNEP
ncbi:hypothetical protein GC163_15515 [bacterium]|nr:hypothetical protein [bacterium]